MPVSPIAIDPSALLHEGAPSHAGAQRARAGFASALAHAFDDAAGAEPQRDAAPGAAVPPKAAPQRAAAGGAQARPTASGEGRENTPGRSVRSQAQADEPAAQGAAPQPPAQAALIAALGAQPAPAQTGPTRPGRNQAGAVGALAPRSAPRSTGSAPAADADASPRFSASARLAPLPAQARALPRFDQGAASPRDERAHPHDPVARKAAPRQAVAEAPHPPAPPPPQAAAQPQQFQAQLQAEAQRDARAPQAAARLASLPPRLAEAAAADASLRLTVLPHAANLKVTAPDGGDLALHLRVRDGVANLTVAGAGADAALARSADLRAALAGQGIALGRIDRVSAAAAASPADAAGPRGRSRAVSSSSSSRDSAAGDDASEGSAASEASLARGLQ